MAGWAHTFHVLKDQWAADPDGVKADLLTWFRTGKMFQWILSAVDIVGDHADGERLTGIAHFCVKGSAADRRIATRDEEQEAKIAYGRQIRMF